MKQIEKSPHHVAFTITAHNLSHSTLSNPTQLISLTSTSPHNTLLHHPPHYTTLHTTAADPTPHHTTTHHTTPHTIAADPTPQRHTTAADQTPHHHHGPPYPALVTRGAPTRQRAADYFNEDPSTTGLRHPQHRMFLVYTPDTITFNPDSGATDILIRRQDSLALQNLHFFTATDPAPAFYVANNTIIYPYAVGTLHPPNTTLTLQAYAFKDEDLADNLFGLAPLLNQGCTATFTGQSCRGPAMKVTNSSFTAQSPPTLTHGNSACPDQAALPPTPSYDMRLTPKLPCTPQLSSATPPSKRWHQPYESNGSPTTQI